MVKITRRPRRLGKKRAVRRRGGIRARRARVGGRAGISEYASLSERYDTAPPGADYFATNAMYSLVDVNLARFNRASAVAANYQYYKIRQVKLTLKYTYDTFQGAVGNSSRPNLFYMFDKSGSVPTNPTLAMLKAMGARPHAMDNKPFTITWTPSVLNEVLNAGGGTLGAQYRLSPWLSTNANILSPGVWNPSTVPHLGLYWFAEQTFAGGVQFSGEIEVQFEFKKPLIKLLPSLVPTQTCVPIEKDQSPDGIVRGPDSQNKIDISGNNIHLN